MAHVEIDGGIGEGGGQILRSSLALAAITGKSVRIRNVRARRRKPGLMRQHLTAVKAIAEICGAKVTGAALHSGDVTFAPGEVKGGSYHFAIGTAGSACLVLQTVLLPLLVAKTPSNLVIEGGTHNPFAPPFDFLAETWLPLLERMGAKVEARLVRPGFYPAGGGRIEISIEPVGRLVPIDLCERGALLDTSAKVVLANLPEVIADREAAQLKRALKLGDAQCVVEIISDGPGPGNVILVRVKSESHTEAFCGFVEKGVHVRKIIHDLSARVEKYLKGVGPVGVHLADQLILPLAMAGGGSFRSIGITAHTSTNIGVVQSFLDVAIETHRQTRGNTLVTFRGAGA